ncbi:MAG: transglycosylase SLT domain-containing protein [Bryobacteraceae bacterium]
MQPQGLRNSFLPPAHSIVETRLVLADPPKIEPRNLYLNEVSDLLTPSLAVPPRPTDVDARIRRAEGHYDAGRKAYREGNFDAARSEFDSAVDILMNTPENAVDRARLERRLDRMVDAIYKYDIEGLGSGDTGDQVVYDKSPLDGILDLTFPIDPRLRPKVKEEVAATQSQLPLEESDAVLRYIHFFSTDRGRRVLEAGMRRSGRYRPMIQRVLGEEGVPQELIYLAQEESSFLPRVVSNKHCTGMWQFGQARGREYGLAQTPYTDDRLDPEKATRAAARHLRDLYSHFGDWYLAMAAYDCGPGCVDRAIQRTGYADFWYLSKMSVLPQETANYVPLILAMTIMEKNPKDYGLDVDPDPPLDYDTVTLTAPTSISLLTDACQCSITAIRDLNPALLKGIAPTDYAVHVPKGVGGAVLAAIESVPASHRNSWRLHRVEPGDTLALLARRYNAPAMSIAASNRADSNSEAGLEEGRMLVIPVSYKPESSPSHRRSAKRTVVRRAYATGLAARSKTATARRAPVRTPSRRVARTTYKTAGLHQPGL